MMAIVAHGGPGLGHPPLGSLLPLIGVATVAAVYTAMALVESRSGQGRWSKWRTASFLGGSLLLGWALSPPFDALADRDFGGHAAQHLLLAMVAPLALVLGAPVTLLLRALPVRHARVVGRATRSLPVRALAQPWVALALSSGGLVVLYFTGLYELTTTSGWGHDLVHLHFFAAGYLFAWVIAGPDPAPHRAPVRTRLIVLGVAIAVHASVAQLLYAGLLVAVHEPVTQMQAAGNLMYFGGDIAELLLALAVLLTWRPQRRLPSPKVDSVASETGASAG